MRFILIVTLLSLLTIYLRSTNLLLHPMYLDEGSYIAWAHLFSEDPGYAYVSLQDGKTPLYFWLLAFFKPFFSDSLMAGRALSTVAGGLTALCWMLMIGWNNHRRGFFYGFLFMVVPYGFLVERMAFVDSLFTAFVSLSLLGLTLARRYFWWAIMSGITLALAYMTKTTAKLVFISELAVIGVWILQLLPSRRWRPVVPLLLSAIIMAFFYREFISYMQIGAYRFWDMIGNKERDLTFTIPQIINLLTSKPWAYLEFARLMESYTLHYIGGILLLLPLGIWQIIRSHRSWLWLIIYPALLYLGILLAGRVMASRYLYIAVPPLMALASFGADWLWDQRFSGKFSVVLILALAFIQSFLMITSNPAHIYTQDDQHYLFYTGLTADDLYQSIDYLWQFPDQPLVGVGGIWGVSNGAQVLFEEYHIPAVLLPESLANTPAHLDIGKLGDLSSPYKYIYTSDPVQRKVLDQSSEVLKVSPGLYRFIGQK